MADAQDSFPETSSYRWSFFVECRTACFTVVRRALCHIYRLGKQSLDGKTMLRIMLVEDDPDIAFVLQELLEAGGHVVVLATHGRDGLDTALMLNPELIITGMMMPYMNGVELLRKLKESGYAGRTILCSSLSQEHLSGSEDLCDAFLLKPFHSQQLLDAISRLCTTPTPGPGVDAPGLMASHEKLDALHDSQEADEPTA